MMLKRTASILALVSLACSHVAAAPPSADQQPTLAPQDPARNDPATDLRKQDGATERTITERYVDPLSRDASYLSTQDYSPRALYMDAHGDFTSKMGRFQPMISGSLTWLPGASLVGKSGEFDQGWVQADAKIPFITGTDTSLTAGAYFDARRFEVDRSFRSVPDETVYAAGIHFGASHFAEDDLLLSALISPGVYSDWDGTLHRRDWQFNGNALATYRTSDDVFLKGGVMWSQDFKDVGAFPLLGVSWLFHPRWRLDVLLPKKVEVSWNPSPAIILHTGVDLEGNRYRVRGPLSSGKPTDDLWAQEITLTAGGIYRFSDNISLFSRVGGAMAGDYKFTNTLGQRVGGSLDPTFLVEVGFGIDF